jgi:hypothetical protein
VSLGYGLEYLPSQDGIPMDEHLKIVYLSIYAHENGKVFNANVRFLGGVYDTYAPKENGEKEEEQYSLF